MTTKHTPGPWEDKPSIHGSEYRYVQIGADERYTTLEVLPADARLIAAAPELLEACQAAKKFLEPNLVEPGRTVFWNLVAALAKARGES